ncbi:MAG: hypothetical protein IIA82_02760 [Thaumarchaeota archaeon]|nr:hypothetical protein [Nitrososphaerota archaeon]
MVKKQLFLTILSEIIVASSLSIFSVTQGLFFTPQFEVDVENMPNNSTKVTMKNIGWAQAKNAIAFIDNTNNVKLITDTCYEGNIENNQRAQYIVKFEKMSTNIDCTLFFNGNLKQYFFILVVADDAPGKSWSFKDQSDNITFLIFTIFPIVLGLIVVFTMSSTSFFVYNTIIVKKDKRVSKLES